MAKSFDQKSVLFKVEATEGTDAVPTGAANAIRTIDYTPTFMDAENKVRNIDKGYLGANPSFLYAFKRGASFGVEMSGAGTATGIPAWMLLNRMCGFGAGAPGASSVVQAGASTSASFTHWAAFLDEQNAANSFLMKAVGGRASMGFNITDDDFPKFTYNYLGFPPALLAEEGAFPASVISNQQTPVLASTENTTITLDGYALGVRSINLSSNAQLELRSLINPKDYIAYVNDSWSGTIVAEVPTLAQHNYFGLIRPGTMMPGQIVHGTVAGNIVQIDMPQIQVTGNVALSAEQGKLMMSMPVTLIPNAGNDEITFTSK